MPETILDETPREAVMRLGAGNPGALSVLVELLHTDFDPDSAFHEMTPIVLMDEYGVKGPAIWQLFNACGRNHITMCALLRAVQHGFFTRDALTLTIENDRAGMSAEADKAVESVRGVLPNFKWDAGIVCP